ncbi:MAG: hypothetical protein NTW96_24365 [Planctomycetia bacterium]|nr:hypothetical protein [Planctomycetia bacterium]
MFARSCLLGLLGYAVLVLPNPQSAEAGIDQIMADWKTRRAMVDTIRYVGKGTITVPKGAFNRDLPEDTPEGVNAPAEDYTYPVEFDWLIDFKNGHMHRKWKRQVFYVSKRQFIPDVTIEAFDGQVRRRWEPRSENASETYVPSVAQAEITDNLYTVVRSEDKGIFFAHGYFPLPGDRHKGPLFQWPVDSADFAIVGESEHDGRRCVILRTAATPDDPKSYQEFWVDPDRDSAVVRWATMRVGAAVESMELKYGLVKGRWLPREMHFNLFWGGAPDVPINALKLELVEVLPDLPVRLEDFQIKPEPGMLVEDMQTGEQYRFGEAQSTSENSRGNWRTALMIAALVLVVLTAALWIRKKRRSAT